jgi:hypothetical protein
MTIREKLIALAESDMDRELFSRWLDEDSWGQCARQRAWERVEMRLGGSTLRCGR